MTPIGLRLQAVNAVLPLAGYLVLHLGSQLSALWGPSAHARWGSVPATAVWAALELGLIYVPLIAHVGLGAWGLSHPRPALEARAGESPLGRLLMGVSGFVLLIFLLFHVSEFRLRLWTGELARSDYYSELCASLSSTRWGGVPLAALGYVLGVAAAAHYGARGLYQAAIGLELIGTSRVPALRRACVLFGLCCFALGTLIVIDLATGSVLIHLPGS